MYQNLLELIPYKYYGNGEYEGATSSEQTLTVDKSSSEIDVSIPSNEIIETESTRISGALHPTFSGEEISIIITKPDTSQYEVIKNTGTRGLFSYSFSPIELGRWQIRASWSGNVNAEGTQSNSITFTVVEPPPLGNFQVLIQDENENPLSGVAVSSTSQPNGQEKLNAITNQNGETTFSDIRVGTYTIFAEKSGYEQYSETTSINEGETTQLIIQISKQISSIIIYVKDSNAKVISDADVTSTSQPSGQQTLAGKTGSDGSVTFSDVRNGGYEFLASKNEFTSSSSSISVSAGETTEKTIILTQEVTESEDINGGGIPGFPFVSILIGILFSVFLFSCVKKSPLNLRANGTECLHRARAACAMNAGSSSPLKTCRLFIHRV